MNSDFFVRDFNEALFIRLNPFFFFFFTYGGVVVCGSALMHNAERCIHSSKLVVEKATFLQIR